MATQLTLNDGSLNSAGSLLLKTNGTTTAVTIDTSQNLGLGVTPSAWTSSFRALDMYGTGSVASASDNMNMTNNAYFNGTNYIYKANGAANRYAQSGGIHYWFTGASGTAGNAITFTQAMTLDASGNLVIGDTSTGYRFDAVVSGTGDLNILSLRTTGASGQGLRLGVNTTNSVTTIKNNTTSGYGMAFYSGSGSSESMRIDSSGNLLVGTTSNPAGVKLVIGGTSGTARIEPVTDNVGYIGEGSYRWQAVYAVNGTIQTSDGREKNTIEDSNLGLSFVQSLRPVSYKWNVGENVVTYDEEGKEVVTPRAGVRTHYGFIAQEVKAAIPEGVDFGGFVQEPNEGMMSLRYHEFIGPLVKAIQEQQAIIEGLTARITALEQV